MAPKSASQQVQEIRELVVAYVKQETVEPITRLKLYLVKSVGGALLMGIGLAFMAVGALRALQGLDAFQSRWASVGAYAIVFTGLMIATALALLVFRPRERRKLDRGRR